MNLSKLRPITICATFFALSGCFQNKPELLDVAAPEDTATTPLFCDVEEPRRFTQTEFDWRSENAPANLRRDIQTNMTWDAECGPEKIRG